MKKQENDNVVGFKPQQQARVQVLDQLFSQHGAHLRAFLRARVDTEEDVEDLMQEVFVRFARMSDLEEKLPKGQRQSRAYLFTTANNLIVDRERHKAVRRQYQERQWAGDSSVYYELSPEVTVSDIQELGVVEQAIMALPPKWRKAFVLSRFGHMEYQQIAKKMGVTTRTVENYISGALIRIRTSVSRATGEQP